MPSDHSTVPSNEKEWQSVLRAFHLTGSSANSESEQLTGQQLWPALASKLEADHRFASQYPLILPAPAEATEETEPASLLDALKNPPHDEGNGSVGKRKDLVLEQIVSAAESIIAESPSREVSKFVTEVLQETTSDNEDSANEQNLRERLSQIPESSWLVGFGPQTLPLLYSWAVAAHWNDLDMRFRKEIEELIGGLEAGLLHRDQEQDPESLSKTMGAEANIFVDLEKLSQNLPPVGGFHNDSEARLELIQETLDVLQAFLATESRAMSFYLITSGSGPEFPELPAESKLTTNDCFKSALEFVDELLERMSRVFRAARIARLLVSGRYQQELHDELFSRFEWQSCNQEEIQLIPKVMVVDSATGAKRRGDLAALCRLLRSGRPIQILIILDGSELSAEELTGTLEDLGSIGLACREAFVFQSTLAQPDQLLAGLREMVKTARPSIGIVSVYSTTQQGDSAWASELLSHYGRLAPCFRYSPDRGPSWSDRLDISGNPQVENGQPVVNLACGALPAEAEKIDESVTFAHAAALRSEFRNHFSVIPNNAWNDDQQPIGAYLAEFKSTPPASLPYIWVVSEGELCRSIMTREMANACRDRYLAWSSLQELAGINSKLVDATREEVQQELEARYQSETEKARTLGREEGTVHAVNRIVEALLGPKTPVSVEQE